MQIHDEHEKLFCQYSISEIHILKSKWHSIRIRGRLLILKWPVTIAYSKCSGSHCAKSSWQIRTVFSVESLLLHSVSERDIRWIRWTASNIRKISKHYKLVCTSALQDASVDLNFLNRILNLVVKILYWNWESSSS